MRTIVRSLFLACLMAAGAVHAATFLQYASQGGLYGDRIGQGQSETITDAQGTFSALAGADTVQIKLQTATGRFWVLIFSAPSLAVGTYADAGTFPVGSTAHARLSITGDGRGCDSAYGQFIVREMVLDASNAVVGFAADFEQHCEDDEPALYGGVRYNSSIPVSLTPPVPPGPASILYQVAGADGGASRPLAWFSARKDGNGGVEVRARTSPLADPFVSLFADFYAPAGQSLGLGTYENAQRHPFNAADRPGLDVSGNAPGPGIGCNTLTGRFTILELVDGPDNTYSKFAADFEQQCDGGARTYGSVRYNSTIPYTPPAPPPVGVAIGNVQDMWWSGSAGNGWGMSVIQHGDTLFNVLFVYDAQGKPTWVAMPGGTWNAPHSAYTGSLYRPHGSAFAAYDAAAFVSGAPVGVATVSFNDENSATLQYTIDGIAGFKLIERQRFGPTVGGNGPHADMWWGGVAQNGWGLAVLEQSPSLFPIWYTYDASGNPVWFAMPVGSWTSASTYEGRIYRTTGSPWLGHDYDPAQLRASDAGSFALRFDGDTARFDYSIDAASGSVPLARQPF